MKTLGDMQFIADHYQGFSPTLIMTRKTFHYLPCSRLDIDSAAPARERALHSKEEAALCVWFLCLFGA